MCEGNLMEEQSLEEKSESLERQGMVTSEGTAEARGGSQRK